MNPDSCWNSEAPQSGERKTPSRGSTGKKIFKALLTAAPLASVKIKRRPQGKWIGIVQRTVE
jgi:hypothetical protein